MNKANRHKCAFLRCHYAGEFEGIDLLRGRLYQTLPDAKAELHQQIRVIDESGEDYLYVAEWFVPVKVTKLVKDILIAQQ